MADGRIDNSKVKKGKNPEESVSFPFRLKRRTRQHLKILQGVWDCDSINEVIEVLVERYGEDANG